MQGVTSEQESVFPHETYVNKLTPSRPVSPNDLCSHIQIPIVIDTSNKKTSYNTSVSYVIILIFFLYISEP